MTVFPLFHADPEAMDFDLQIVNSFPSLSLLRLHDDPRNPERS